MFLISLMKAYEVSKIPSFSTSKGEFPLNSKSDTKPKWIVTFQLAAMDGDTRIDNSKMSWHWGSTVSKRLALQAWGWVQIPEPMLKTRWKWWYLPAVTDQGRHTRDSSHSLTELRANKRPCFKMQTTQWRTPEEWRLSLLSDPCTHHPRSHPLEKCW